MRIFCLFAVSCITFWCSPPTQISQQKPWEPFKEKLVTPMMNSESAAVYNLGNSVVHLRKDTGTIKILCSNYRYKDGKRRQRVYTGEILVVVHGASKLLIVLAQTVKPADDLSQTVAIAAFDATSAARVRIANEETIRAKINGDFRSDPSHFLEKLVVKQDALLYADIEIFSSSF